MGSPWLLIWIAISGMRWPVVANYPYAKLWLLCRRDPAYNNVPYLFEPKNTNYMLLLYYIIFTLVFSRRSHARSKKNANATYDRKHLHSNTVVSPVNAVGSHRTPSDGAHFGHAQNKRRGSNTRALGITVGSSYQRSKVSYNAIRAPWARTMVVVQTPRSSVVFARRCYGVLWDVTASSTCTCRQHTRNCSARIVLWAPWKRNESVVRGLRISNKNSVGYRHAIERHASSVSTP